MKTVKLRDNVEFGNTARDILLRKDLEAEVIGRKSQYDEFRNWYEAYGIREIEFTIENNRIVLQLFNKNHELISKSDIDDETLGLNRFACKFALSDDGKLQLLNSDGDKLDEFELKTFVESKLKELNLDERFDAKQDKLIAGKNIKIDGNVISSTGGGSGRGYDEYHHESEAVLDSIRESGVYEIDKALDAPTDNDQGILEVNQLVDDEEEIIKVSQKWMSPADKKWAMRLVDATAPEPEFFVNGLPVSANKDGIVELEAGNIYRITGKLAGCIRIGQAGKAENNLTELILAGVAIKSQQREAIAFLSDGTNAEGKKAEGDLLSVEIEKDTENFLIVETDNPYDKSSGESDTGTLYSASDMIVNGTGCLSIKNNSGHGIKASDLTIAGLTHIYVDAVHDAFHGSGDLKVTGGTFDIANANDAFSCGKELEPGKTADKYFEISGGKIDVMNCKENAFEAKDTCCSAIIHGKTTITVERAGKGIKSNKVKIYDTVTLNGKKDDLESFEGLFGAPTIIGISGAVLPDANKVFTLEEDNGVYNVSGNFSDYRIVIKGKKTTLNSNNLYVNKKTSDGEPFIDYQVNSKNIQLNTADGKITYIKTVEDACLSSAKNVQIAQKGTIILECEGGDAINAVLGDTIIKGSGARYISSAAINRLHLGVDTEEYYSSDINSMTSETYSPTKPSPVDVSKMCLYMDKIYLYKRLSSAGTNNGAVIALPQYAGCAVINNIYEGEADSRAVAIYGKAFTENASGADYEYNPIIYSKNFDVAVENIKTWSAPKEHASNEFPDISRKTEAWVVYGGGDTADLESRLESALAAIAQLNVNYAALESRVRHLEEEQPGTDPSLDPETGELTLNNIEFAEDLDLGTRAMIDEHDELIL